MPISSLPIPPSRQDPTNFNDRADAFLGALPLFQSEANALQTNVNTSEVNAVNSAVAVLAATNIVKWVSGTTYANGAVVWSPINGLGYRRITTSGSGTTDPSADSTNYKQVNGTGDVSTSGNQTIAGVKTFSNGIVGNVTGSVTGNVTGDVSGNAGTATSPQSGGSFITSSNIGSQSVNFANSATNATNATNASTVTTVTTAQVLNATAGASHQDVGSMTIAFNTTTNDVASNVTIAGSSLRYTSSSTYSMFGNVTSGSSSFPTTGTVAMSGTWKNMGGYCRGRVTASDGGDPPVTSYIWYPSIWLRIA
jgi:hypothetical protein